MDAQEHSNLSQAYNKVHQLDEISAELAKNAGEERMNRTFALMKKDWKEGRKTPSPEFQKSYKKQQDDERRYRKKLEKEEVDIYDIVLSHLLDEGYAETSEAAEVIMVNMSEEWREGIIEAYKPWDFGPKQKAKAKYTELLKTKQSEVSRGIPGGRGTATRANKIGRVGTEMRRTLDKDTQETGADPKKQGLQPSTRRHTEAARRRASRGLPSASTARKSYG